MAQALDTPMGEVMAMAEGEAEPEPVTEDLEGLEGEAEADPQTQHQVGWAESMANFQQANRPFQGLQHGSKVMVSSNIIMWNQTSCKIPSFFSEIPKFVGLQKYPGSIIASTWLIEITYKLH